MAELNTLRSLRKRVIAATGPDREIDANVWLALLPGVTRKTTHVPHWKRPYDIDETRDETGRLIVVPDYTASIDAARALVNRVLPGWWVSSGTCNLTGHASLGPDYNGPDRERLFREFPVERYDGVFHEDLAPGDAPGREAQAILAALLSALIARAEETTNAAD